MKRATEPTGFLSRHFVALTAAAFLVGVASGLIPGGDIARACSCLPPPPPLEALAVADAVFHGRVIRTRWADGFADPGLGEAEVTFQVYDRWKGPEGSTFVLFTEGSGAMCGYHFMIGEDYIVYAYSDDAGRFSATNCSRTQPYDSGEAAALGPSTSVAPVDEMPGTSCPRCAAPLPPPEAMAEADAVFHGWAIDLEQGVEGDVGRRRITFEVVTWWKGGTGQNVSIDLPHGYWGCEPEQFRLSSRSESEGLIVYAHRDDESGRLELLLCGRTRLYTPDEAAALGSGTPPEGSVPTPTSEGTVGTPTSPIGTASATATTLPPFPIGTDVPTLGKKIFIPLASAGAGTGTGVFVVNESPYPCPNPSSSPSRSNAT